MALKLADVSNSTESFHNLIAVFALSLRRKESPLEEAPGAQLLGRFIAT